VRLFLGTTLVLALVAHGAACAPPCSTDADCGEDGLCINGECKQRSGDPATDAGSSDAAAAGDGATATDRAAPDQARADTGTAADAARPDTTTTSDSAAPDTAQQIDAAAPDAGADADAATIDSGASDSATAADAATPGRIGDPCQDHSDCVEPFGAYCITAWSGGYCSAPCTWNGFPGECGMDAECYCEDLIGGDCFVATCYRTCWMYSECRDGYRCETPDWLGFYGDEDLCYP